MPQVVVTLQQQTPMIHFQSDEEGATIRASELKPRLDRFLLRWAFGVVDHAAADGTYHGAQYEDLPEDIRKCFIPGTTALNYRLTVRANSMKVIAPSDLRKTPFFAIADEGGAPKRAVMANGDVTVTFRFSDDEAGSLRRILRKWAAPFFAVTNFGFRKSKGFGAFTVKAIDGRADANNAFEAAWRKVKTRDQELVSTAPPVYYAKALKIAVANAGDEVGVMKAIQNLYMRMKSGVNFGGYTPSALMKGYAYHRTGMKYSNEKRKMKLVFRQVVTAGNKQRYHNENKEIMDPVSEYPSGEYRYVRAMLGLADHFDFGQSTLHEFTVNVAHTGETIKRFESPLLFKPVQMPGTQNWAVYVLLRTIHQDMFDAAFEFSLHQNAAGSERSFTIRTPSAEEFDLYGFVNYFIDAANGYRRDFGGRVIPTTFSFTWI